ncbi:hypothetical protein OIO90_001921 [Microbotryomycetes sp. JL221]|nr:hypothetical protein OIO90_001921 [Microbotryomycetes sp. JL221]
MSPAVVSLPAIRVAPPSPKTHRQRRCEDHLATTGPPLIPFTPKHPWYSTPPGIATVAISILIMLYLIATTFTKARDRFEFVHRNGSNIDVFRDWTIQAPDGSIKATFIGLGATLTNLWVPDKYGRLRDVVVGYDDREKYLKDPNYAYFGAIVGRYANRIRNSSFAIPPVRDLSRLPPGSQVYHVTPNEHDNRNTLHGGMWGYSRAGWSLLQHTDERVVFGLTDVEGTEGFPATVHTVVSYTVSRGGVWTTSLHSTVTNGETPLLMSSHVYWNLDGYLLGPNQKEPITALNHSLRINSSNWIKTDGILVPTGDVGVITRGNVMDFRQERQIGDRIDHSRGTCGPGCIGYDNCFIYDTPHAIYKDTVMELASRQSGIRMSIKTNQLASQLYTCNGLQSTISRKQSQGGPEQTYGQHSCVVLEQQGRIGGINQPQWGEDQVYDDQRPYDWWTEYRFTAE